MNRSPEQPQGQGHIYGGENTLSGSIQINGNIYGPTNFPQEIIQSIKNSFLVPYPQNKHFTLRPALSEHFIECLDKKDDNEQIRLAIHGLGGAGKTQFILDFVYKAKSKYEHIIWAHAASLETFEADYYNAATELPILAVSANTKPEEVRKAAKRWLDSDQSGNWLFILDNIDDLTLAEVMNKWLPVRRGTMIFTTRDQRITSKFAVEQCITIKDMMTYEEATQTFTSIIKLPTYMYDLVLVDEQLKSLFERIEYLPLAIVQAASYIAFTGTTINEYLHQLTTNEVSILEYPIHDMTHTPQSISVMTTWKISYDSIKERDLLATSILDVMSLLHYQQIPRYLLESQDLQLKGTRAISDIEFNMAVGLLLSFSLISLTISRTNDISGYRLHRLVSLWTKQNLQPVESTRIQNNVLKMLDSVFQPKQDNIAECQAVVQHVKHVTDCSNTTTFYVKTVIDLICMEGLFYDYAGQYAQAVARYQGALQNCERLLSKEHPVTLKIIQRIAIVFMQQEQYEDALKLFKRALEGQEKSLDKDHSDTLHTVHNIALVYMQQGQYKEALEWFARALEGYKKSLGEDHLCTLNAIQGIAMVLNFQGQHDRALEWFERALKGIEISLGQDHPSTLSAVHNTATVFKNQGRYDKALKWFTRALEGKERFLGKEHPITLSTVYEVAEIYRNEEKYSLALEYFRRVSQGCRKGFNTELENYLKAEKHITEVEAILRLLSPGGSDATSELAAASSASGSHEENTLQQAYSLQQGETPTCSVDKVAQTETPNTQRTQHISVRTMRSRLKRTSSQTCDNNNGSMEVKSLNSNVILPYFPSSLFTSKHAFALFCFTLLCLAIFRNTV